MRDVRDILLRDDLTDEDVRRIAAELDSRPAERADVCSQLRLLRRAHERIEAALPDRQLLVLEGLRRAAGDDCLDASERSRLESTRSQLDEALDQHPGLRDVVASIERDVHCFEDCWNDRPSESRSRGIASRRNGLEMDRSARRPVRSNSMRWVWRTGAAVAVAVFVALIVTLGQRDSELVTIATASDETRVIELADGSTVRLLPDSRVAYRVEERAAGFSRFVRLDGDAYFEIAPGREGFTVETPTAVVTVLGTDFGVRAGVDTAEVVLASGRVSVASQAARSRPVVLEPGQATSVAKGNLPSSPRGADLVDALSWTGLLVFHNTPVSVATSRFQELYGRDLTVDPRLGNESVTGTFDPSIEFEHNVRTLADALGAEIINRANGLHLTLP